MELALKKCQFKQWISLSALTLVFVIGELSHFLLGIVTRPMSQEIEYGDQGCLANPSMTSELNASFFEKCHSANNSKSCDVIGLVGGSNMTSCIWNYSGLGIEYQILAGPAFIAVFTISGILIGMISDRFNRHIVVSVFLGILNVATILMGVATAFWQLVIFRMLIGAGESAFMPACSSMISDIFEKNQQGLAMGIFTWGIYFGYALAYIIGNFVTSANYFDMGWRNSYLLTGGLGMLVLLYLLFVVKEPPRQPASQAEGSDCRADDGSQMKVSKSEEHKIKYKNIFGNLIHGESGLIRVLASFFNAPVLILLVAACSRHTAGFTWAYNTQLYFSTYYPSYNLGIWISMVSILGGSFGVTIGGYVSDKLVVRLGLKARLYVLAASMLLATPFSVGVLYLSPPGAFFSLLGSYFFAEMWFGILFAILVEVFPSKIHSTAIALFLFVMNNVGGNMPVVVTLLRKHFSYRVTLLIMYPGNYLLSSMLFFLASFFIKSPKSEKEEVGNSL